MDELKKEKGFFKRTFGKLWKTISVYVLRFPGIVLLSLVLAGLSSWSVCHYESDFEHLIESGVWASVLVLFFQLLCEKTSVAKKENVITNVIIQVLLGGLAFVGWAQFDFELGYYNAEVIFWGLFVAMIFTSVFLSVWKNKEDSVSQRTFTSLVVSFVLFLVIAAGLAVVTSAFVTLILNRDVYRSIEIIFTSSVFIVFLNCFIAFWTSENQDTQNTKALKILFNFILFPLYVFLIFVLYVYLIKCLILFKTPSGKINWFVSFSTLFFMIFFFAMKKFETVSSRLFYKIGAYVMFPLIVVQLIAFGIRIKAYGWTAPRYASLVYIIAVTGFILLSLLKKGRFAAYGILFFAAGSIVVSIPGINIHDIPGKSQLGRLEKVLKKNGLLVDGRHYRVKTHDDISDEDWEIIESSFREVVGWEKRPDWMVPYLRSNFDRDAFNKFFIETTYLDFDSRMELESLGEEEEPLELQEEESFIFQEEEENDGPFRRRELTILENPERMALDISSYSHMAQIRERTYGISGKEVILYCDDPEGGRISFPATEAFKKVMEEIKENPDDSFYGPVVFDSGDLHVIITDCSMIFSDFDLDGTKICGYYVNSINGFVFW